MTPNSRGVGPEAGDPAARSVAAVSMRAIDRMSSLLLYCQDQTLALVVAEVIEQEPQFELIAVCSTLADLMHMVDYAPGDMALLDLTPEIDINVLSDIQRRAPRMRLVLWTDSVHVEAGWRAIGLEAGGRLSKALQPEQLVACLRHLQRHELLFEGYFAARADPKQQPAVSRAKTQECDAAPQIGEHGFCDRV